MITIDKTIYNYITSGPFWENDFLFLGRTRLHDEYRHSITLHVSLRLITLLCAVRSYLKCFHVTHTHAHPLPSPTDRHYSSP